MEQIWAILVISKILQYLKLFRKLLLISIVKIDIYMLQLLQELLESFKLTEY